MSIDLLSSAEFLISMFSLRNQHKIWRPLYLLLHLLSKFHPSLEGRGVIRVHVQIHFSSHEEMLISTLMFYANNMNSLFYVFFDTNECAVGLAVVFPL